MGRRGFFTRLAVLLLVGAGSLTPTLADKPLPSDHPASSKTPASPVFTQPTTPGIPVDDRLRRLETINQEIIQRLDRSERERKQSEDRYRTLEEKYEALRKRLELEPPATEHSSRPAGGGEPGTNHTKENLGEHPESTPRRIGRLVRMVARRGRARGPSRLNAWHLHPWIREQLERRRT